MNGARDDEETDEVSSSSDLLLVHHYLTVVPREEQRYLQWYLPPCLPVTIEAGDLVSHDKWNSVGGT